MSQDENDLVQWVSAMLLGELTQGGNTDWSITIDGRTVRWATRPRWSLPPAVLPPFGLGPHSGSTTETLDVYLYPFPNPYSHNPSYRKRGQVNSGHDLRRARMHTPTNQTADHRATKY